MEALPSTSTPLCLEEERDVEGKNGINYNEPRAELRKMDRCNRDFEEDSDDSIRDQTYQPDSNAESSEKNADSEPENEPVFKKSEGRPGRGRKRKFPEQDRHLRKVYTNSNKRHYTAKGNLVQPKEFIEFKCKCLANCHEKISLEEQRNFFQQYWNLADYNVQTTFLSTYIRESSVKKKLVTAKNPQMRNFSRQYFINKTEVCRDMFINVLRVSTKRINTALCKVRKLEIPDRRGLSSGGHNKMSADQESAVITHINQFPRYKSHYCRSTKGNQEFLQEGTTLTIMYKLYKIANLKPVSFSSYKKIFLTKFNLRQKKPKKDTCNKCDTFSAKIKGLTNEEEKIKVQSEHDLHLQEAETARKEMNLDLEIAENNENTETVTFDMQKTLPLPRLSTNILFYKRQLWLYNCGIYAGKQKKSTFNIWIEGEAGRGAQEVGSCLRKYIAMNNISESVENLIFWSDSCGGQNRNIKMVLMMKCILEETLHLKSIRIRFLVSGHSFLPNDSDFGDVECAIKKQNKIFSPQDYINIMRTCRRKRRININRMVKDDFVSTKKLEKAIVNRKKTCEAEKINWLHIKEIKILKEKKNSIFIRAGYNDESEYKEINIKKGKGPNVNLSTLLEPLWPNGKEVAEAKLKDIKSYLHLIPEEDHPFYKNLIGNPNIVEDIDGYNMDLDFDLEEY